MEADRCSKNLRHGMKQRGLARIRGSRGSGEPVDDHVLHVACSIPRGSSYCVVSAAVGNKEQARIFVLEPDPVLEHAVVTKVQAAGGAHAGEDRSAYIMSDQLEKYENQAFEHGYERPHDQAENIGEKQQKKNRETPALKLRKLHGEAITATG